MNVNFYVLPNTVGLKFDNAACREDFWNSLSKMNRNGFSPQSAAERIGQRTIRFYPAKMKQGFEWLFETRQQQQVPVIERTQPVSTPNQPARPDTVTIDPFAKTSANPTRVMAGITPPPPAEMLAEPPPAPAVPEPQASPQPDPVAPEPPCALGHSDSRKPQHSPEPQLDTDFEPIDRRTRAWREWKARHT